LPGEIVLCETKKDDNGAFHLAKRFAILDGGHDQFAAMRQLLDLRVKILVSDPWALIEDGTNSVRYGYVSHVGNNPWVSDDSALIVTIEKPIVDKGKAWVHLLATTRHVGNDSSELRLML